MTGEAARAVPITIAVTSGEPAGIGPELCAALARRQWPVRLVVVGDENLIAQRALASGSHVGLRRYEPAASSLPGTIEILHEPLAVASRAGELDPANARHVLRPARSGDRRLSARRVRRHGHGAAAQGRDQRRRHRVLRPYRVPCRANRHRQGGDDARRSVERPRRPCAARGARHHPSRARATCRGPSPANR